MKFNKEELDALEEIFPNGKNSEDLPNGVCEVLDEISYTPPEEEPEGEPLRKEWKPHKYTYRYFIRPKFYAEVDRALEKHLNSQSEKC